MSAKDTNLLVTKSTIPLEVEIYTPKKTGIEKFQFFYTRDFMNIGSFFPVWTIFDITIVEIATENSPLAIIEHGWDSNRERHRVFKFLFDSMDNNFERFGVIDLRESEKRPWYIQIFHKILDPARVGLWKLNSTFPEYFLEGDGVGRGAFWYIYGLRREMASDEFISLLEEYTYKFVRSGDLFNPNRPQLDNIVAIPDIETLIFKDFTSARLCVSTSDRLIARKIIEFSRSSGVFIQPKIGDINITNIDHIDTWSRFIIYEKKKEG